MRFRVTIAVLVFGAVLLAGLFLLHQKRSAPENDSQPSPVLVGTSEIASETSGPSTNSGQKTMNPPRSLSAADEAPSAGEATGDTPEEKHRAYVEARSSG